MYKFHGTQIQMPQNQICPNSLCAAIRPLPKFHRSILYTFFYLHGKVQAERRSSAQVMAVPTSVAQKPTLALSRKRALAQVSTYTYTGSTVVVPYATAWISTCCSH